MATFHMVLANFALAAFLLFTPAAPAYAACTNPAGAAGKIVYNGDGKVLQYCDDTAWVRMNDRAGSGAGGCANPTLPEGQVVYNADYKVPQVCAGNVHRALGPIGGSDVDWTQIAIGYTHVCAVRSDGRGFCWGMNNIGQLGNGTTTDSTLPVEISGGHRWSSLTVGLLHTCGITTAGIGYCWGEGANSRLGTGTTTDQTSPTAISGGGTWIRIDAGVYHACGIKSDNNLYCWGWGNNGRMGDGASTDNTTPGLVSDTAEAGSPDTWIDISVTRDHSCGIQTSGNAWCWGSAGGGALGEGSITGTFTTPQAVGGGFTYSAITAGEQFTCAIRSTGAGYCWGNDSSGQLGNGGSGVNVATPTAMTGGGTWTNIYAGENGACGVKNDNNAWCWGGFNYGGFGNGTYTTSSQSPVQVSNVGSGNFTQVASSTLVNCGIQDDGDLFCWGNSSYGLAGNGETTYLNVPKSIFPKTAWSMIDTTRYHSCGIKTDGSLWCWGLASSGEIGHGASPAAPVSLPATASGGGTWKQVSTGGYHSCALKTDHTLWCWGSGDNGRLGNGSGTYRNVPTAAGTAHWKHISTGNFFTCGIMLDSDTVTGGNQNENEIYCWGGDANGQQGNGAGVTADQTTPAIIAVAGPWTTVEAGWNHACAIKAADSTLWCWGSDASGQQGNGATTGNIDTPTQLGVATWTDIAGGQSHTCGLQSDGSAWCWGFGGNGNLGQGAFANTTSPVAVSGGHVFSKITVGNHHSCGIRASDNVALCWGWNGQGKVGIGTWNDVNIPTLVSAGETWSNIAGGEWHMCGVSEDNEGFCWGSAYYGQLGNEWDVFTTGQQSGCGAPSGQLGSLRYNSDYSVMQYCDGAGWVAIGKGFDTPGEIVTSGLVGFWKFDESNGAGAADSSGTGNHGLLTNFPASPWLPSGGQVDGGLDFDGTNDFVDVPDDATLDFERTDSFSIAAWIYRDTSSTEDDIIEKVESNYKGYALWLPEDGNSMGGDDILIASISGVPNFDIVVRTSAGTMPQGAWTHVAMTYSGSGLASGVALYINGISQSVTITQDDLGANSILNNESLKIGTDLVGFGDCCVFDGKIDDVRIYNRVLTPGEVTQLAAQ